MDHPANGDTDQASRSGTLRAVVVGCGAMGRRHARVLASAKERFVLAGVVDEDATRAAETAEAWGTRVLDARAALDAPADVVVVATPIASHVELCRSALEAGRHVLVEKPIAATAAEARTLVADAVRARRRLFVGHSERYNPVIRALVRLLRRDPPLALELHRIGSIAAPRVRDRDLGVLLNLGVHDLDLVAYLASSPAHVHDALGRALGDGPEDLAHVLVATQSGAAAHLYVDRTSREKHRTVRVTTERFLYEGDLLAHKLLRSPRGNSTGRAKQELPLVAEEPLAAQANALADAIAGKRVRSIATGADGARAVELAHDAAARIAARGASAENLSRFARP